MRIVLFFVLFYAAGCGDSSFSRNGEDSGGNTSAPAERRSQADHFSQGETDDSELSRAIGENAVGKIGGDGGEIGPEFCWFAVSGAQFGFHGALRENSYNTVFPLTKSGRPIGHGEVFDDVGGVYLNAKDEAYEYNRGNRELDKAIDETFDSIVVAPGMQVEIRGGDGQILFAGQGPYMANSDDRLATNSLDHIPDLLRQRSNFMPGWMVRYLEARDYSLARIPLHAARYVKVTKVPNVGCNP